MNNSLKGALLSGLVYPGLGQIVQRHYGRGAALISVVTVSVFVIVSSAFRQIATITAKIETIGGSDVATLLEETSRISANPGNESVKLASALMLGCWVIGIVDAYLSGKKAAGRS